MVNIQDLYRDITIVILSAFSKQNTTKTLREEDREEFTDTPVQITVPAHFRSSWYITEPSACSGHTEPLDLYNSSAGYVIPWKAEDRLGEILRIMQMHLPWLRAAPHNVRFVIQEEDISYSGEDDYRHAPAHMSRIPAYIRTTMIQAGYILLFSVPLS